MQDPVVRLTVLGHDSDIIRRFYCDVLGWPPANEAPLRQEAGVIAARGSHRLPLEDAMALARTRLLYAKVPDLAAALGKALSYGSEVLVPPTLLRHTVVAVVSDPEGNPVGLCT